MQGQLVRINNVKFIPQDGLDVLGIYHENVNQTIQDANGAQLTIRTSGYSNFWNTPLPEENGDIVGILGYYYNANDPETSWQLTLIDKEGMMNFGNPTLPLGSKERPYTITEAVKAETAGTSAHWKCDVCGKLFSDAEGKTETTLEKLAIPATGHTYGAPVWKWNDDFTASATFTCGNDDSHVKKVDATVTSEVTEGSCEVGGTRTYTAKVTFEGKEYTDTKTETLPATGHDTELVGAKDATCTEDGYTGDEVCKVCGVTVKQGEVLPALGHDYKDGKCSRCGAEEPTTPVEPGKPQQPEKPTTPDTPATGDESQLMLWVSGMLVCALGAGLMLRRKKEN